MATHLLADEIAILDDIRFDGLLVEIMGSVPQNLRHDFKTTLLDALAVAGIAAARHVDGLSLDEIDSLDREFAAGRRLPDEVAA